MSTALSVVDTEQQSAQKYEQAFIMGDLNALTDGERLQYYMTVCQSLGLNPATRPLEFLRLNGQKLVLYARKDCTDQLRALRGVSVSKPELSIKDGLCIVSIAAQDRTGRTDSDIGVVTIGNLQGDARANMLMKAITKAKRRVTLSICGLGILDETEIETIPDARPVEMNLETGAIVVPAEESQQQGAEPKRTVAELFQEKAASFGFTRTKKDELRHLAKVLLVREPTKKDDYRACLDFCNDDWRKSCQQAEADIADVSPPAQTAEPAPLVEVPPADHTVEAMTK